jgi:TP901 family phage tail tape measure protein
MAATNRIDFTVGFNTDQSGLSTIKKSLEEIQKMTSSDLMNLNKGMDLSEANSRLTQIKESASQVQKALDKAFNADLGTLNVSKFNNELKNLDINKIYNDFNSAGSAGQTAFKNMTTQVLTTNMQLKQTHSFLENMATTLSNTIKWNIASGAMNALTNNVQQAVNYVEKLDTSLNNIRIVTGKSAEEMRDFAESASQTAQELSASTRDITEGALIYYQQGDTDENALAKAEITQKTANVSQISSEQAAEYLTAVWNGYKVANEAAAEGMDVYEKYVDKLAAVAATTASDLAESSMAISKVASAASSMGVDFDQLNAQIATIISVTRQAPESVGTALKTIYARMGDLAVDGVDEFGVSLGEVSGKMKTMGIDILDENGHLKEMGNVIEEVAGKWSTWTDEQRQAAAVAIAGKRQYNNLIALFDNWDMYTDALDTSKNALGTLEEQQDIYSERTEAHIQRMRTTFEDLYDSLLKPEAINEVVDGITFVVDKIATLVDNIGGGKTVLAELGSLGVRVFSKQIAGGISTTIANFKNVKSNAEQLNAQLEILQQYKGLSALDEDTKELVNMKQEIVDLGSVATTEQQNIANGFIEQINALQNQKKQLEENEEAAKNLYKALTNEELDLDSLRGKGKEAEKTDTYKEVQKQVAETQKQYKSLNKEASNYAGALTLATFNQRQASKDSSKQEEAIKSYEALTTTVKNYNDEVKKVISSSPEVASAYENFNKKLKEYSELTGNAEKSVGELIATYPELSKAFKEVTEASKDYASQAASDAQKVMKTVQDVAAGTGEQVKEKLDESRSAWKSFIDDVRNTAVIQSALDIAGSIGEIGSSIVSLKGIWDVFSDESLSATEKLGQSFTILLSTLPLLINGIQGLQAGLITLAQTAIPALAGSSLTAGEAFLALFSASWIGWAAAAVAAIAGVVFIIDRMTVSAKEAKEALESQFEEYEKAQQEVDELNSKLETTQERLKELYQISPDELTLAQKEELKTLEAQNAALATQLELRKNVAKAEEKKTVEAAEQAAKKDAYGKELNTASVDASVDRSQLAEVSGINIGNGRKVQDILLDDSVAKFQLGDEKAYEEYKAQAEYSISEIRNLLAKENTGINYDQREALKAYVSNLEFTLSSVNKKWENSSGEVSKSLTDAYDNALKQIPLLEETGSKYVDYYYNIVEQYYRKTDTLGFATKQAFGEALSENKEAFDKMKAEIEKEGGIDVLLADDGKKLRNVIGSNAFESLKEYSTQTGLSLETLLKSLNEIDAKYDDIKDGASIAANTEKKEIEELTKKQEQYQEELDKKSVISEISTQLASEGSLDKLSKSKEGKATLETFNQMLEETAGIYNKNVSAAQEFEEAAARGVLGQIEYLEDLREADSNYYTEVIELEKQKLEAELDSNKKILEGYAHRKTELTMHINQLEDIREKEGSLSKEQLDELSNAQVELEAVTEKYNEYQNAVSDTKKEIEDTDWELKIDLAGAEEILSIGDSILSESDKIREAAMMIGEGYVVASEDAKQLAEVFPEIMENAEVLADGQIQLNQGVVEETLTGQQSILHGDVTTALSRIDSQIKILTAQKEAAEAELELWQSVYQGKVDMDSQALEAMAGGQKSFTEYLVDLGVKESDADKAVKEAMAGNYDELARIAKDASINMDQNLSQGIQDAANNSKTNLGAVVTNFMAVMRAAQEAGKAAAASTDGKVAGDYIDPNNLSGGGWSQNFTGKTLDAKFKGAENNVSTETKEFAADKINEAKIRINKYTKAISEMEALASRLRENEANSNLALESAKAGAGGSTPFEKDKSSKGGKGSGGKGGSSSDAQADKIDLLQDESEVYHDIDLEIKNITKDLDALQKKQEKLTGKELTKNLQEQLDLLEKQKKAYGEKIEVAEIRSGAYKSALKQEGVTFDADGNITNYFNIMKTKLDNVNKMITKYNGMSKAEQKKYKQTVEDAKKDYENFKKILSKYEDLKADEKEIKKQQQEVEDKATEVRIKKFTLKVDLALDTAQAERDFNAFKKKVIDGIKDDDFSGQANALLSNFSSYVKPDGTGEIQALTDQLNKTKSEIEIMEAGGKSTIYGDNLAKAYEDLEKYEKNAETALENYAQISKDIEETYLSAIDKAQEKLDEQSEQYEFISDLIDHDKDVIGLIYGDKAYSQLAKYYEMQRKNNNDNLDFARKQVEFWKQRMDNEEKDSKAWKEYKANYEKAVTDLNSKVKSSIEEVIEEYKNTINKIFEDINKRLTNGSGLDHVKDQWDLINKNADMYLDSINSSFEIQKLQNKYLDSIDNTSSLSAQKKLNNLMNEQIEMLKAKEKLTQYDVDRANALYEIALKEIALQDAQKNKSKMRLRRDSQGNYSYQYVSDEDSIAQAQQELLEAQNSLYNLDKDKYKSNLDEIYSTYSEFQQKLLELYSDTTLADEEREEKKKLLAEQYGEIINNLVEQNEQVKQNLQDTTFQELAKKYNTDVANFQGMSDEEKRILMESMIPQWNSGVQQMADKFAGEGGFIPTCENAFKQLDEALLTYRNNLSETSERSGVDFNKIAEGYDMNIQKAKELLEENDKLLEKYKAQLEAVQDVLQEVKQLEEAYRGVAAAAISAVTEANKLKQQKDKEAREEADKDAAGNGKSGDNKKNNKSNKGGGKNTIVDVKADPSDTPASAADMDEGGKKFKVGDKVKLLKGKRYYYTSEGAEPSGNRGAGQNKPGTITQIEKGAKKPIHVQSNDGPFGWLTKDDIKKFDTGGYTGAWNGNEGKVGILHQKELVLNKEDTKNFLSAMNVVRSLDSVLDTINASMMDRLIGLLAQTTTSLSGISASQDLTIDQKVQIEASFPNVQNSGEIEEAFKNLVNYASQHAYDTKR